MMSVPISMHVCMGRKSALPWHASTCRLCLRHMQIIELHCEKLLACARSKWRRGYPPALPQNLQILLRVIRQACLVMTLKRGLSTISQQKDGH